MSLIRSADGRNATKIPYQKHPHAPTAKVLHARNAQLRIRLWEFEQLFTALTSFNEGKTFSNYASPGKKPRQNPCLVHELDLRPGHVTWAGHSFGACTAVQFVKSVYYRESLPSLQGTEFENDLDWRPLLKVTQNSALVKQVTPESPVILLDLWTMPLRGGLTKWLWEKPLPCYTRQLPDEGPAPPTSVVAIVSSEFFKWPELLDRMKAGLSARPAEAMYTLEKRTSADSTNYKPRTKSSLQLVATPGDKLPPGVEEPDEFVPPQGFEKHRGDDQRSDTESENEAPFDKINMEALKQPLPESDVALKDEGANGAGAERASIRVEAAPMRREKDLRAEATSKFRPITSSNLTTDSSSSLPAPTPSNQLSRTPSPSPSTSTCDSNSTSVSSVSVQPSAIEVPKNTSSGGHELSFNLYINSSVPPLHPKSRMLPTSNTPSPLDPHLYLIPNTAHLSQSDFGVLFPNVTRYLMNAENPVETIQLNVRAMLAVMRNAGLDVEVYRDKQDKSEKKCKAEKAEGGDEVEAADEDDQLLTEECKEERWVRVDIY